jgi:transcription elongation factor GreA
VNSRLAMLRKRIAEISIMNMDKIPHDRAAFGSTVHLREDNGETVVFTLVMPEEADAAKGLISTSSPIGRGIVGKTQGDEITVATPNGPRSFEVLKLITVHDEA